MPNLPTDSTKKTADGRGVGVENLGKFADVLNGWSLIVIALEIILAVSMRTNYGNRLIISNAITTTYKKISCNQILQTASQYYASFKMT